MKNILPIILFSLLVWSCGTDSKKPESKEPVAEQLSIPAFSADSAYAFIQQQVDFGPRVPNTPGHEACGDWITAKLKEFGAEVTVQEFEATTYDGQLYQLRNIIGTFNPSASKRILLGAHWDTRKFADKDTVRQNEPIDGANDGASGVGVLLEIARLIGKDAGPGVGIDIIFFDGEDNGSEEAYDGPDFAEHNGWCLGSQYWSKNKHKPNYSAYYGILLDMVGARDSRFLRELESMSFAPSVVKKVWDQAADLGHHRYFIYKDGGSILDDHIFVYNWGKIQMIDVIDYDPETYFRSYHHTHADNMDIIDKKVLIAVGETVMNVIYREKPSS